MEQATRDQVGSNVQIKKWIEEGLLSLDEAAAAFPGWANTAARDPGTTGTDYKAVLDAYENYALVHSKAHDPHRKTHLNNMTLARKVVEWLSANFPARALVHVFNRRVDPTEDADLWQEGAAQQSVAHSLHDGRQR
jgi:hypothetical protein